MVVRLWFVKGGVVPSPMSEGEKKMKVADDRVDDKDGFNRTMVGSRDIHVWLEI